jgi:protein-disulfide isomerase
MAMVNLRTPITKSDHVRGPESAPITLVEYGDAHRIVDRVQPNFSGRGRLVFRHFPMAEVHPHPEIAAESAEFAGAAGLFWDMHDALFVNQSRLSLPTIFLIAEQLGLTETALRNALETGQYRNKVRSEFMGGIRSGLNGTPTFFINGVRHDSGHDYASLVAGIQMRLAADTSA